MEIDSSRPRVLEMPEKVVAAFLQEERDDSEDDEDYYEPLRNVHTEPCDFSCAEDCRYDCKDKKEYRESNQVPAEGLQGYLEHCRCTIGYCCLKHHARRSPRGHIITRTVMLHNVSVTTVKVVFLQFQYPRYLSTRARSVSSRRLMILVKIPGIRITVEIIHIPHRENIITCRWTSG